MTYLLDEFKTILSFLNEEVNYPPANIYVNQDNNNIIFEFALAGWKQEDIDVFVEDNILIVKGTKKQVDNSENKYYLQKKIAHRSFEVKYMISEKYDISNPICVEFDNGVLRLIFGLKDGVNKKHKIF